MMNLEDVTRLSDDDLAALLDAARAEYQRRHTLAQVVAETPAVTDAYMESIGRGNGEPFVTPLGAHDAYPLGWEVEHDGRAWLALRDGAHGTPGESGDWREVPEDGVILAWVQPTGAHDAYEPGAIVTHNGGTWRNDHTVPNAWEPGTAHSQWTHIDGDSNGD